VSLISWNKLDRPTFKPFTLPKIYGPFLPLDDFRSMPEVLHLVIDNFYGVFNTYTRSTLL